MAVSYSRQIPPGGTGQVTLKVKTDGKAGEKISHQATVYTDDPDQATIELTLTGEVVSPADINPKAARLVGIAGSAVRTKIKITPPALNPFDIKEARAMKGESITFSLEKKPGPSGPYFILTLTNTQKAPGRYSDKIILTTTSTISPELIIRVYGLIR